MRSYFREGDVFILDKGFRDVVAQLRNYGYQAHMPDSLFEGHHQLTTEQANKSRCVTMCRWVIEVINGRLKRDFKLFRQEYFNKSAKHLMEDFRIGCALLNKFHHIIEEKPDYSEYLEIAKQKLNEPNHLSLIVNREQLNRRRSVNNYLLRGRIKSRHVSSRTYYTYLLLNKNEETRDTLSAISGYYCSCLVGSRTVGCCAHVMTITWYLSWGRHNDVNAPAQFLDNVNSALDRIQSISYEELLETLESSEESHSHFQTNLVEVQHAPPSPQPPSSNNVQMNDIEINDVLFESQIATSISEENDKYYSELFQVYSGLQNKVRQWSNKVENFRDKGVFEKDLKSLITERINQELQVKKDWVTKWL
ncbi:uncharacterized protein LOC124542519 [Vanessa cardui]|uniref:uncharacterized protein LOC124542519 n=1 Tax=Vanessa cardui TaxID=171605 RepID=UPI001F148220|nr:uncharacterized protein LOC124542519 [Vanessa cardui]